MPMKVTSSEAGIEIAVTSVERIETRKTKITRIAAARPSRPSVASVSMERSIEGAWSKTTVNSVFEPTFAATSSSASETACETSTVLPVAVLVIATASEGSPLTRAIESEGLSTSSTLARSSIVSSCASEVVTSPKPGTVSVLVV